MRRHGPTLMLTLTVAAAVLLPSLPAGAEESTSVSVDTATIQNGSILLSGTLTAGDDLFGPVTVVTDPSGDASAPGGGVDLGDATIATDLAGRKLVFSLGLNDGVAAGGTPFVGYSWPFSVDGTDTTQWLGAGGPGTNFPPKTNGWAALCTVADGWICSTTIAGGPDAEAVRWTLPFFRSDPQIAPGTTIDIGGSYGAVPASFVWPSAIITAGLVNADSAGYPEPYVVPGEIRLGIAPAGTAEPLVDYTGTANLNPGTGAFTGALPAPAAGTYTLYAKTCGGLQSAPVCAVGTADITV